MSKEQLESLSYTDLAELILKNKKKGLNTPKLFTEIKKLIALSDEEYESQIGDFYTSLTTDKRFVLVDNAWDLRDRHSVSVVMEDDEDEEEEVDDSVVETVESEDIDEMDDEDGIDDEEDDIGDLSIIDDEPIDEEE